MNRLLLVSYHFPPDAEVGGLRAQKYSKYLPFWGWTPLILTVQEKYYPVLDPGRCEDVGCDIVRTVMFRSPRDMYLGARKAWQRLSGGGNPGASDSPTAGGNSVELGERKIRGLKKFILSLLWLPDDRTGWILPAAAEGIRLIRKNKIRTFMTTSPPHSVQIIGLIIKMFTGCRWVADFRDPWTLFLGKGERCFFRIHSFLERQVVRGADMVITATEQSRLYLRSRYPAVSEDKFVCIPNGYDLEDFEKARRRMPPEERRFTLSYIGDLYAGRNPEIFLKAVAGLIKEGLLPEDRIRLRFVGNVRYYQGRPLQELISVLGIASVTEIVGHVPYYKAMEYIAGSDVLVVLSPQPFVQPTKVFEYMASGACVLAFTPPGALAEIVNRYPGGFVINEDPEEARKAVLSCYRWFNNGRRRTSPECLPELRYYERRNLAGMLSKYL
jgi:glycosyltransferase involved in cell wall biosynthesis